MNLADSGKALANILISAVAALITALAGFGSDATIGDVDARSWLIALAAVLASGGLVWWSENVQGVAGTAIKAVVSFLSAGVASLVIALDDGVITQAEWLAAFSAAVLATGFVYQLPGPKPTPPETPVPVTGPTT